MELTARDRRLIEDIVLHHVMTSQQTVALGYFSSLSRANRRLLTLVRAGLLERVTVNASFQARKALYRASKHARGSIDQRVATLLARRRCSPLQLDHSLAAVDVRIKLRDLRMDRWLAEPQCRHKYTIQRGSLTQAEDFRPDGVATFREWLVFVEVDRGTVSLARFKAKLDGYATYVRSGVLVETYGQVQPVLLVVTTGALRQRHLMHSLPSKFPMPARIHTSTSFQLIERCEELAR